MPLIIPDDTVRATRLTPDELRLEIAVMLFAAEKLTLGQAASFVGLPQSAFQRILGDRKVPVHYDAADLAEDLDTLQRLGLR